MSEKDKEYRPSPFLWRMALLFLGTNVFVTTVLLTLSVAFTVSPWVAIPIIYTLTNGIVFAFAVMQKDPQTTWHHQFERHRTHNRIGFQRVWMLDEGLNLASRIERRDHQNAQLNTSEYALYEKLSGWGGRQYRLARKSVGISESIECRGTYITGAVPGYVRMRSSDTDVLLSIRTLLQVININASEDLSSAFTNLAEAAIARSVQASEVEGLRTALTTAQQRADRLDEIRKVLENIVDCAGKRGTRVHDLRVLASKALEK